MLCGRRNKDTTFCENKNNCQKKLKTSNISWISGSVDIITTAGAVDRELIYIERIGEADWNGGAGGSVGFVGELGRGKFGLVETMLEALVDVNMKLCFVIHKIQNLCNQLSGLYLKGPKLFERVMTIFFF